VLSLHVKLTAETRGGVTASDLALMKPTALLVNTARGELIEPGALAAALVSGRPGMAAVDVFEREPAHPADEPLLRLDNALCTPHLGFVELDTYEQYFADAFTRVAAFAEGREIPVLDPRALEHR
jgi:D-3-phosphoglycerate dehydrogenase